MSDTKWTPGPWYPGCFVETDSTCKCRYIFSEGYMGSVAQVSLDNGCRIQHGGNDSPALEEARANALLIAATPELYEALRSLCEHERPSNWDEVDEDFPEEAVASANRWREADAILAKARGDRP